ncbi:MAG: thiol:disulfide interchange protein DsbA/DsbL [Solimonas sp.]
MKLRVPLPGRALLCALLLCAAVPPALAAPPGLTPGEDYMLISGGAPLDPQPGKIEVVEMFNYACPACNAFNPQLAQWKKKLPADVKFVYAPLDFRPDFVPYARAYYAAEALGLVDKTHEAVYAAVHDSHKLPGEGQPPDEAKIAAFYAGYGANAAAFQASMDSFTVSTRVARAKQFAMQSRVISTPSLVIDGRYLVKGKSWDDMLRIADALIADQRKR